MGICRVWVWTDGRCGIGSLLFHCWNGLAVGRICSGSCSQQVRIDASSDLREYLCFHLIMWTILQVINSCYRPEPSHSYLYVQTCEYCLRYVCKSLRTIQVSTRRCLTVIWTRWLYILHGCLGLSELLIRQCRCFEHAFHTEWSILESISFTKRAYRYFDDTLLASKDVCRPPGR